MDRGGSHDEGPKSIRSFDAPDRVLEVPGVREEIVELSGFSVGRATHAVGWRWSVDARPRIRTERCEVRHVGVVISGRIGFELVDGTVATARAGEVYDVPAGHDGWTVGDEPAVVVEWIGVHEWLLPDHGERILATVLVTDLVGSTDRAVALGDRQWRRLLNHHDEIVRSVLAATSGREVATTGDGFLALFDGPAHAIEAARAIRARLAAIGLEVRQGIHVGEVELRGHDVRGVAVHEAARIGAIAGAGEILVSDVTRAVTGRSGIEFGSRGSHVLKGLEGEYALFAVR